MQMRLKLSMLVRSASRRHYWIITSDDGQNGTTRHDADCLAASMDTIECFYDYFQNTVLTYLTRYNDTSNSTQLQSTTRDLKLAIDLLESLHTFANDLRVRFDEFEVRALTLLTLLNIFQLFSARVSTVNVMTIAH